MKALPDLARGVRIALLGNWTGNGVHGQGREKLAFKYYPTRNGKRRHHHSGYYFNAYRGNNAVQVVTIPINTYAQHAFVFTLCDVLTNQNPGVMDISKRFRKGCTPESMDKNYRAW